MCTENGKPSSKRQNTDFRQRVGTGSGQACHVCLVCMISLDYKTPVQHSIQILSTTLEIRTLFLLEQFGQAFHAQQLVVKPASHDSHMTDLSVLSRNVDGGE